MSPPPSREDYDETASWGWRYRIEGELAKVKAILEERGPRRDNWERECGVKLSEIEKRLGVVELLCKGTSDSSTPFGRIMAILRDPPALVIIFLVVSMLINAGLGPQELIAAISGSSQ